MSGKWAHGAKSPAAGSSNSDGQLGEPRIVAIDMAKGGEVTSTWTGGSKSARNLAMASEDAAETHRILEEQGFVAAKAYMRGRMIEKGMTPAEAEVFVDTMPQQLMAAKLTGEMDAVKHTVAVNKSDMHKAQFEEARARHQANMLQAQLDGDYVPATTVDGKPINRLVTMQPMNPICDAAEAGNLATLTALVARGVKINMTGENGNSALAFACANGHADCTSFLISKGANVDQCSNVGHSPLHAACWADSTRCARILLDAKANINLASKTAGTTPMHVAVQAERDEVLELLVMRGANRNLKDRSNNKTALQLAVSLGHKECEKVLRKADVADLVQRKKREEAERKVKEVQANAAADALLAELEAESGGGGDKKESSRKAKKKAAKEAAKQAETGGSSKDPVKPLSDELGGIDITDKDDEPEKLDEDALMASVLLGGKGKKGKQRETGAVVSRCPFCGSRAKATADGRCPSCKSDLVNLKPGPVVRPVGSPGGPQFAIPKNPEAPFKP